MHIKKGDNVIVLVGKDKGKKGKVVKAIPKTNRVVVEGVNVYKKHKKPGRGGEKGSIVEITRSVDISNVKLAK